MKIIDLLTKYANGGLEKIRVKCNNSKNEWYDEDFLFSVYRNFGGRNNDEIVEFLNDEVEIIEEPKKIEIPKHIPNEVIQDLDRAICPANVKCIAHKVNELINYLQHTNKGDSNK